jgi:hypothetical protein
MVKPGQSLSISGQCLSTERLSRNYLKGQMDDVKVYNSALSEAQTHAMMLAPQSPKQKPKPTHLVNVNRNTVPEEMRVFSRILRPLRSGGVLKPPETVLFPSHSRMQVSHRGDYHQCPWGAGPSTAETLQGNRETRALKWVCLTG